jgi:hypothetical protein
VGRFTFRATGAFQVRGGCWLRADVPETHQSQGWRGLDMFHGNKKFGFETFADIERRGLHFPPRQRLDRTRSIETKHLGSWLEALNAGGAHPDVSLASRYKID